MIFINPFIAQNEFKNVFWTCFAARALSTTEVKILNIMRTKLRLDEMNGIKKCMVVTPVISITHAKFHVEFCKLRFDNNLVLYLMSCVDFFGYKHPLKPVWRVDLGKISELSH